MAYYADVAAVRIQTWLTRTPQLRGRRGASALLSESTSAGEMKKLLPADCEINPEAGDIDGVVSLRGSQREAVERGSQVVAQSMRAAMPGLEIVESEIAEATDYVTAYTSLHAKRHAWRPAPAEITFALPCVYCGSGPAVAWADLSPDDKAQPVCSDCDARLAKAGFSTAGVDDLLPPTQVELRTRLGDLRKFPGDFSSLAAMDGQTHLATVFCDGNRMGALFQALAKQGLNQKKDLGKQIDAASVAALDQAIRDITQNNDSLLPITVHLMGGDDLLATVPALRAWAFTTAYLSYFEDNLRAWCSDHKLSNFTPSASAGVVIHHNSFPFTRVVSDAETCLRAAKEAVRGRAAEIAWRDITTDAVALRGPRPMTWFSTHESELENLARVPQSQQDSLRRAPGNTVQALVSRLGITDARPFLPDDLPDALSITKWMPHG